MALAGAAAGEMAAGLLLYSTEGFLRALTVVLVVEMLALGVGFLSSRRGEPGDVDALRRRWLVAVFAFAAAAVFAGLWTLNDGGLEPRLPQGVVQGLGLGFLAALPLFTTGAVLGGLASPWPGTDRSRGRSRGAGVAGPAFFGAAGGLLFTGLFGVPNLQPASLYLFCVVTVSGGALLHGWIVDRRIRIVPLEVRGDLSSSRWDGHVHWERRLRTTPSAEIRVLRVNGTVADAAAVPLGGTSGGEGNRREDGARVTPAALVSCLPWQRHVLGLVGDEFGREPNGPRVLLVGLGAGALLSELDSGGSEAIVVLDTEIPGQPTGSPVDATVVGSWEAVSEVAPPDGFDLVIVQLRLIPRDGPFGSLNVRFLERALSFRGVAGVVLLGGMDLEGDTVTGRTLEWLSDRCGVPASVFRPGAGTWTWSAETWDDLVASLGDRGGGLVACRPAEPSTVPPDDPGAVPEEHGP